MGIEELGTLPDGRIVHQVTLAVGDARLHILDLGAAVEAWVPSGLSRSVIPGFDGNVVERWSQRSLYSAAIVGRYLSRIRDGRFTLDGTTYDLATNENGHTLHGGPDGFDARTWHIDAHDERAATLSLVSPDGDQGFPGTVTASVTYRLTADTVTVALAATTDAPTVVGLGSHAYFDVGSDPVLTVPASRWVPVDDEAVALPGSRPVEGSGHDPRTGLSVGPDAGIDFSYLVDGEGRRPMARLAGSDGTIDIEGDQPALQVYTGSPRGVALEVQRESDGPNRPGTAATLRPGETFASTTVWRFSPA